MMVKTIGSNTNIVHRWETIFPATCLASADPSVLGSNGFSWRSFSLSSKMRRLLSGPSPFETSETFPARANGPPGTGPVSLAPLPIASANLRAEHGFRNLGQVPFAFLPDISVGGQFEQMFLIH